IQDGNGPVRQLRNVILDRSRTIFDITAAAKVVYNLLKELFDIVKDARESAFSQIRNMYRPVQSTVEFLADYLLSSLRFVQSQRPVENVLDGMVDSTCMLLEKQNLGVPNLPVIETELKSRVELLSLLAPSV